MIAYFWVLLNSEVVKIGATKPFLFILVPLGGWGSCACVGKVCYKNIVYILKSNKNSIFFASTSNLCRAMLSNYLRTYSWALGQIRALEKAFTKSQTMAKVYLKSWFWMHAFDWPKQTVKIYMLSISPRTMTCAELCSQTTWGHIPQLFE